MLSRYILPLWLKADGPAVQVAEAMDLSSEAQRDLPGRAGLAVPVPMLSTCCEYLFPHPMYTQSQGLKEKLALPRVHHCLGFRL